MYVAHGACCSFKILIYNRLLKSEGIGIGIGICHFNEPMPLGEYHSKQIKESITQRYHNTHERYILYPVFTASVVALFDGIQSPNHRSARLFRPQPPQGSVVVRETFDVLGVFVVPDDDV